MRAPGVRPIALDTSPSPWNCRRWNDPAIARILRPAGPLHNLYTPRARRALIACGMELSLAESSLSAVHLCLYVPFCDCLRLSAPLIMFSAGGTGDRWSIAAKRIGWRKVRTPPLLYGRATRLVTPGGTARNGRATDSATETRPPVTNAPRRPAEGKTFRWPLMAVLSGKGETVR